MTPEGLDPDQRAAAHATGPRVLVIAGPGSGKTRVIAERIRWLVDERRTPAERILCMTFSNAAADELRRCAGSPDPRRPSISTIHAFCLRVLRSEASALEGHGGSFSVWGGSTQRRVVRSILRDLGFEARHHPSGEVLARLAKARARAALAALDARDEGGVDALGPYRSVLQRYEMHMRRACALDFDGMLIEAKSLFARDEEALTRWRNRFDHILLDEAQDTSALQWSVLASLIDDAEADVFIVGDPDQALYGWRGAMPEHLAILSARSSFETLALERNYRSPANVLEAADALIGYVENRVPKTILPSKESGPEILSLVAESAFEEARSIAILLRQFEADGTPFDEMAVLYRTNAQSRIFESTLRRRGIPCAVRGGVDFFERREIQDVLAYLAVVDNPRNDAAFWRAASAPVRGIGPVTERRLQEMVDEINFDVFWTEQTTLPDAVASARVRSRFKGRTREGLADLSELLESLTPLAGEPAYVLIQRVVLTLETTDWLDAMSNAGDGGERRENLDELLRHAKDFHARFPDDGVQGFLADVALASREENARDENGDRKEAAVNLMTLHGAKGSEFEIVVIAGLEEEGIPHRRALESPDGIDDERRLLFVGMTRAKRQLVLSWSRSRQIGDVAVPREPSRFFEEIPADLVARLVPEQLDVLKTVNGARTSHGLERGDAVEHDHFGKGRVVAFMSRDADERVLVDFESFGPRELFLAHTKLRREL